VGVTLSVRPLKEGATMSIVVAVMNPKGGSGKTTVAVHLSYALSLRASKGCLIVDLDPTNSNATEHVVNADKLNAIKRRKTSDIYHLLSQSKCTRKSIEQRIVPGPDIRYSLFTNQPIPIKREDTAALVDILPSRTQFDSKYLSKPDWQLSLKEIVRRLKQYKYIIIDCPPLSFDLTKLAYLASDYILVPVKPEMHNVKGLETTSLYLRELRHEFPDHTPHFLGVVITNFNYSSSNVPAQDTAIDQIKVKCKSNKWDIFRTQIEYSQSYIKASLNGDFISDVKGVQGRTKSNFENFVYEFVERVGSHPKRPTPPVRRE
jgi:chromosome partitioning protein